MGTLLGPLILLFLLLWVCVCAILYFTVYNLVLLLLGGISLPVLAKRRGISKGWLAWLPIGCDRILGDIADHGHRKALGVNTGFGKLLPALSILLVCLLVICLVSGTGMALTTDFESFIDSYGTARKFSTLDIVKDIFCMVCQMLCLGSFLAVLVVFYIKSLLSNIAFYCIFLSCNPKTALLLSVLGFLFGGQIFLLFCLKKDSVLLQTEPLPPEEDPIPLPQ